MNSAEMREIDAPELRAINWVAGENVGISSKAIWTHMMGGDLTQSRGFGWGNHPHDPDDFFRCYNLLRLIPEWRLRIGEMAQYSKEWKALTDNWDELTALLDEEMKGERFGKCPKLYARMKELFRSVEGR